MLVVERVIVASSVVWAGALLLWRFFAAWGGGRRDFSVRAGDPARGVLYNFTTGMAPAHKESARLHPFNFTVGMVMHAGVLLVVVKTAILIVEPAAPSVAPAPLGGFLGLATASAFFLFVRRVFSRDLRPISNLDDYFAAFATACCLAAAFLHEFGAIGSGVFLLVAAAAAFYVPLGKIRHVLFCPVARFDLGRRLGYRGTFPVKRGAKSRNGGR